MPMYKSAAVVPKLLKAIRSMDLAAQQSAQEIGYRAHLRLAITLSSRDTANPVDTDGNPRLNLSHLTNFKVWRIPDFSGYSAIVGVKKPGNHINMLNSGTKYREREARTFFRSGIYAGMGTRAGGKGGIAGKYVWVELRIRAGKAPEWKRRTGEQEATLVLQKVSDASQGDFQKIVNDAFARNMS